MTNLQAGQKWHNELGSVMTIDNVNPQTGVISGTYESQVGVTQKNLYHGRPHGHHANGKKRGLGRELGESVSQRSLSDNLVWTDADSDQWRSHHPHHLAAHLSDHSR